MIVEAKKFDNTVSDSQATAVKPLSPSAFDVEAYSAYENELQERCRGFIAADSGILVYRRTRVAEVFSAGCRDMERSLECQLGALNASMAFKADIPNFLEPWYGIGTAAAAFGIDYIWEKGQAPAIRPAFDTVREALDYDVVPIKDTECGRHTLEMISFFIEKTGGKLPISLCDMQSPLNVICNMVDSTSIYLAMMDDPDEVRDLLDKVADLILDFTADQKTLLGEMMVRPGHGFPSVRSFPSVGLSDDNIIMLSNEMYTGIASSSFSRIGSACGGSTFHSCGNWAGKFEAVKKLDNLFMVDGAFSPATDPSPNDPELFGKAFAGTGTILNARIVGSADEVVNVVEKLWSPGLKLIVTTYCETPDEQAECYDRIKKIESTEKTG
jgi:hypothetical protein